MSSKALEVVAKFWELMMTNDFRAVGSCHNQSAGLEWLPSSQLSALGGVYLLVKVGAIGQGGRIWSRTRC
jgi:hypothetical protein